MECCLERGDLARKWLGLLLVRVLRVGWASLEPIEFGVEFLDCDILEAPQIGAFLAFLVPGCQRGLKCPVPSMGVDERIPRSVASRDNASLRADFGALGHS